MRIRAGVVLVENGKVALIERHRAGRHYYVFPGGGVDEGETTEQAAIREVEEETGLQVTLERKLAEIYFGLSEQVYYLAERLDGKFGRRKLACERGQCHSTMHHRHVEVWHRSRAGNIPG